jgi:uroporphyrinogen-III decarboxylase
VQTEEDHAMLAQVCSEIGSREETIRRYFRDFRARVGEDGVIVIGHPHVSWLGYQVSQQNLIFHRQDYPEAFKRSMEAIMEASLVVFSIAVEEGIDFMSESCSGLEMTSPGEFDEVDLPVLVTLSEWTHARGGLFWYHNCGQTRELIRNGRFNRFSPDVLETIAPPPEGDNDLAQSRRALDERICSKGNLSLGTLRNGTPEDVTRQTLAIAEAVRGFRHIFSTADAVLPGTPPENLIAFVRTATQTIKERTS